MPTFRYGGRRAPSQRLAFRDDLLAVRTYSFGWGRVNALNAVLIARSERRRSKVAPIVTAVLAKRKTAGRAR